MGQLSEAARRAVALRIAPELAEMKVCLLVEGTTSGVIVSVVVNGTGILHRHVGGVIPPIDACATKLALWAHEAAGEAGFFLPLDSPWEFSETLESVSAELELKDDDNA